MDQKNVYKCNDEYKQLETWLHPLIIFTISCKLFMITVILFNFAFSLLLLLSLLLLFPILLLLLLLLLLLYIIYIIYSFYI